MQGRVWDERKGQINLYSILLIGCSSSEVT